MRPYPRGFYAVLLILLLILFITGSWSAISVLSERFEYMLEFDVPMSPLMKTHGGAAMLFLLGLGALLPMHVRLGLLRKKNRISGLLMLGINGLLMISAWGLYYLGSAKFRQLASDIHLISAGVLLISLGAHLLEATRIRKSRHLA